MEIFKASGTYTPPCGHVRVKRRGFLGRLGFTKAMPVYGEQKLIITCVGAAGSQPPTNDQGGV